METQTEDLANGRSTPQPVIIEGETVEHAAIELAEDVEVAPDTAVETPPPPAEQPSIDETAVTALAVPDTPPAEAALSPEEFDALRALTSLLVGGAIEGSNELLERLRKYEAELAQEAAENADEDGEATAATPPPDTTQDILRYMLVGMAFDTQRSVGRGLSLAGRFAESYLTMAQQVARPVTHNRLTNPIQRRIDRLAARGQERVESWIKTGRDAEPHSRALARRTYTSIVDEFISLLAENPEVQDLVTKQSLSLAGEVRDEVRERTVTADNVVENLVRRILRREPRESLPEPDPAVQEWATRGLRTSQNQDK